MAYGTVNTDIVSDSSGGKLAPISSVFRNRIINGAMVINQRGFSGTPANGDYTLDRWFALITQSSKFTVSQNAGSVTPPVGFTNYLGCTSSSAYSVGASDYFIMYQYIEGFNTADLGWGTASAKTVTLSFQVYSSLTGTFGGSILNNNNNRSYPFTYTVSSANTWTPISITIAGDTTGTWETTTSTGIKVGFGLGAGSTVSGTAGTWSGTLYRSATGATSVVGTSGATFYITGVQLEVGTQATQFTTAGGSYGAELALCQRYYLSGKQDVSISGISGRYVRQLLITANLRTTPTTTYSYDGSSGAVTAIESNLVNSLISIWCRSDVGTYIDGNVTYTASAEL